MNRKKTRVIRVGDVLIGGTNPISIQSMTNTNTKNYIETAKQINEMEEYGLDIIRFAVNDLEDAAAIKEIKSRIKVPTIADIQYDYKLALASIENGIDGLRINPGNIGARWKVEEVAKACMDRGISIRIGVNAGSLSQEILDAFSGVNENSIVESALNEVNVLESMGFKYIKVSLKASDVNLSLRSYKKFSELSDCPLHLGITEAGPGLQGVVKSSVGIGTLLSQGIGDTIRVSLTERPLEEVKVGREILKSLGLRNDGIEIISCPTCARTKVDLFKIVKKAQDHFEKMDKNLKVAIMGCAVNGPGEAREADIGIASGKGCGLIFKKGKIVKKVKEEQLLEELIKEMEDM
ncbi:flavodoxin-dependent (E)-4-hydroxy-3-methylbut-2-enyl-diphosphate synthase [Peptoniphilus sp. GNH]|nr:flavodoxin-dependent (E)-4-hydroxy-3-methylbut-2-enyl-diphosphate synthase [Peptoniphilus sp. GNH]